MNALNQDIQAEGGCQPSTVIIPLINEKKLEDFIFGLQRNIPRYQLAKYNCSHVAAECLKIACEKEPSFQPCAHEYS